MESNSVNHIAVDEMLLKNSISFFSNRTDKQLVEKINSHERTLANLTKSKRKTKSLQTMIARDQQFINILYAVLQHRGYFD